MKTIHLISQLDTTIVVTDKQPKHELDCQKSVRLTNKQKIDIFGRVDKVHNQMLKIAANEARKDKKKEFYNKRKNK